jgi:DNA-binding response OmpR family regulator
VTRTAPSVLIVEDDEVVRAVLARTIGTITPHVEQASNGEQAWQSFQQRDFDLLVTDLKMPALNGLDLVRRLRASGKQTPVIIVSGYTRVEDERVISELGATLLTKPFGADELRRVVLHALGRP